MKMSSFNARWSVLLVLIAGTMLVIAGCSSPTGSDGGSGSGTITITSEVATEFNGTHTVSSVVFIKRDGETDSQTLERISGFTDTGNNTVVFCLEQNSNAPMRVSWVRNNLEELVVAVGGAGPTSFNFTKSSPETTSDIVNRRPTHNAGKLTLDMVVEVVGAIKLVGSVQQDVTRFNITYTFDINQMDIRVLPPIGEICP